MQISIPVFLLVGFFLLFFNQKTEARLGDSMRALEARLIQSGPGLEYGREERDRKIDGRIPYQVVLDNFTGEIEVKVYFKPASNQRVRPSQLRDNPRMPGWDLHVIYYRGISVLEAYIRNGQAMSEFEWRGLLVANQGGSHWQQKRPDDPTEHIFSYQFQTADGRKRALRQGNNAIFYMVEFEELVVAERSEQAPDSLAGF